MPTLPPAWSEPDSCPERLQVALALTSDDMMIDTIGFYRQWPTSSKTTCVPRPPMTVDLSDGYSFPTHIAATDLRPNIVWWNDDQKTITLVELTVCFEMWGSDHEERGPVPWPDCQNAEGRIHIHPDHCRDGIKRPSKHVWIPETPWCPQTTPPRILQTATGHITASHPRIIQDLVFLEQHLPLHEHCFSICFLMCEYIYTYI